MKFKDLYEKDIDRKLNPAVSASDLNEETVKVEIEEYVFTQEIIVNLYNILYNIKHNQGNHVGIWINGYFGSGKSHFLKYASYCLSQKYADKAFARLVEATENVLRNDKDPLALLQADVDLNKLRDLRNWYINDANVEMIMFNIGDVHDVNANQATAFTTIFWNQFNGKRGFNTFNLALAQYLEKALADDGKFDDFKEYLRTKNYDWKRDIARFAGGRLDLALKMANEVDPDLSIDVIREKIISKDVNVSVEAFAAEMKEYLDGKGKDYRVVFFVDEVSQFIGEHRDLLLQLQSLVERLHDVCESKVWIACTAQQTIEDVVNGVGSSVINPNDEVGKIRGRFEVRASLQGTNPEYITQRRILDKKGDVEIELAKMYENNKARLDAQFVLPNTYRSFDGKDDFVAFYPFVPYQLQLFMKVLDSFVNMAYVDREVKGNERSLLNITFSIAKETAECEVGEFISFDKFFGAKFQSTLQHSGQRAIENARLAVKLIKDQKQQTFARRVVYVLFMISNLSDADKQSFSATIDNIVTLLMTKIDANKAAIKAEVAEVLQYLMDKSVIRKFKTENNSEIYDFYTQEESKVAEIIKNQQVDSNTYAEELYKIIYNHFGFSSSTNKVTYATRSFNVGINVDGRTWMSNNPDVVVEFLTTFMTDALEQFAFNNPNNHIVFFLYPQWKESAELRQNFLDYCRVQRFAQEPAISEERQKTKRMFQNRAKEMYEKDIKPKFQHILDTCPIIAGHNVLSSVEMGTDKKQERYKKALTCHLNNFYEFAQLVNIPEIPKTPSELSSKILRPVEATLFETPLSRAEQKVKDYLDRQPHDMTVADVIRNFAKDPYGWSDFASIYTINELVRRHLYAFVYNNNPNVSREEVARSIVKEANKFTVEPAKAISQDVINQFIAAWKHIFKVVAVPGSNDSTELYRNCKEMDNSALNKLLQNYRALSKKLQSCPCVEVVEEAITLMESWSKIHDHKEFFETITNSKDHAAKLFDSCQNINVFADEQYDNYEKIIKFLDDNKDNFTFLSESQQAAVNSLKAIQEDKKPWEKMPSYLKLMRSLNTELQECKNQLVKSVKENYDKIYDVLEDYAKTVNYPVENLAKRDVTILKKTNTNNFYALQTNSDTRSFYNEQMKIISKTTNRRQKVITLTTYTTKPIRTEEDVDLYLKNLKAEIMQHLKNDEDIIIN